tara:strand:- start:465 stop:1178 length:714 start_codon:yes stop_codon:yes gene_type:complete
MDSIIFQGNVIGMLAYIVSAMFLFSWIIKDIEEKLVERKLYIACGLGVVLGTFADIIMILGGINGYNEDFGYASKILVSPIIMLIFLFIGVNRKTFKEETGAPYYSAGFGLFYGGSIEFWKLLVTEEVHDLSMFDFLIIAAFGFSTVVFLGGAAMWVSYGIQRNEGARIASRFSILYLVLSFLNTLALEEIHYSIYDTIVVPLISLLGFFVISFAVFHQAKLKLPLLGKKKKKSLKT